MLYAVKSGTTGPQLRSISSPADLTEGEVAYDGPIAMQSDGITIDMQFDPKRGLRSKTEEERLVDLKKRKCEQIKADADAALRKGCETSLGFNMDFDRESVSSLTSYHALAERLQLKEVVVCDYDNKTHTLTWEQFETVLLEIGTQHQNVWLEKWDRRQAANAAKSVDDLGQIRRKQ